MIRTANRIFLMLLVVFLIAGAARACEPGWTGAYGLSQDWTQEDRAVWYGSSQGSRLLPVSWYDALPLAGSEARFAARANQDRYASLFCANSDLPVGFVIDSVPGKPDALGLTCAACHTGRLSTPGYDFIVEGGSTELDLQSFMTDLFAALDAVYEDGTGGPGGPVWQGFAADVLGTNHSRTQADTLHAELAAWLDHRAPIQQSIEAGGTWGHGRSDAVQVILNTASVLSGVRAGATLPPSTAPVSTPHVWNAPQMERVQWNGSSYKVLDMGLLQPMELGALVRNVAEAIGVFAEIEITADLMSDTASYPGLTSSIRMDNLVRLERSLETLKSPVWPAAWGAIDRTSANWQRGRDLYALNCSGCHAPLDRNDLNVRVPDVVPHSAPPDGPFTRHILAFDMPGYAPAAGRLSVGTDPMNACNAQTHTSWAGKFQALHDSFGALRRLNAIRAGGKSSIRSALRALQLEKFPEGIATLRLIEELSIRIVWDKKGELTAMQTEDASSSIRSLFTAIRDGLFGADPGRPVDPASTPDVPVQGTHSATTVAAATTRCAQFLADQAAAGLGEFVVEYKARPLNGIFASPPYLHNGSVPTLADLLLPPAQRPETFLTGGVNYDPVRAGLGPARPGADTTTFQVRGPDGLIIPGNSNRGHTFPAIPLNEADRAALLTYLKSL